MKEPIAKKISLHPLGIGLISLMTKYIYMVRSILQKSTIDLQKTEFPLQTGKSYNHYHPNIPTNHS